MLDSVPLNRHLHPQLMQDKSTTKHISQAQLSEYSTELYRMLVDEIDEQAIFVLDLLGTIVTWNRGAECLTGYTGAEAIGSHFSKLYLAQDLERAFSTGQHYREGWQGKKDGSRFWASIKLKEFSLPGKGFVGYSVVLGDLTKLRQTENQFEELYESAPDMYVSVDAETAKILRCNQTFCKTLGYLKSEVIGRDIFEFYHNDSLPEIHEAFEAFKTTGEINDREFQVKRKDGSIIQISLSVTAHRDEDGKIIHSRASWRDISERKRNEEALLTAIRARDEFLSIASHELKTPLTSLKLQSQVRRRNLNRKNAEMFTLDKLEKLFEGDERQLSRLHRLIDDMLDISRISSGKLTMRPESFDLCELVRDVASRFAEQFSAVNCHVRIDVSTPVVGFWDRFRIEQVIANLFTNAMKYGSGKPIEVTVLLDGKKAIVSVRDHGRGIAKEDLERIFQQFERAVHANEISGLGLGLFIVRQILFAHSGAIRVESELGQGSCFTVELPV